MNKTFKEKIEEILNTHCTSCDKDERTKVAQLLLTLFAEVVKESKPKTYMIGEIECLHGSGGEKALDQYESSLLKRIGEK